MILSRRNVIAAGGSFLAGSILSLGRAAAQDVVEITMRGNADGSDVWFDPIGLLVRPGQTVRWVNRDPGNSHTSTAYHPSNEDRPLRIPAAAATWNSDYLLPDQSFSVVLSEPGVYDYFCIPHEHAGMVGRIVVAQQGGSMPVAPAGSPIEGFGADIFPAVEAILQQGRVLRPGSS